MSNFAIEIAKYLHEWTQIGDKTGAKLARINLLTKKVVFLHILFVPLHPQIKKAPCRVLAHLQKGYGLKNVWKQQKNNYMHKNFNMMKRYAIPLVKTFGSAALSNVRMNLSASHTRMLLSMTMLVMMMLAPQGVKADTFNFDWHYWLNGATNAYLNASGIDTNCSGAIIMSGNDYDGIEGAQTVTRVQYRSKNGNKYSTSKMEVNERLAFVLNTEGKANEYNGNNGWYLRAEPNGSGGYNHRALYTGCWNSKLAVLSLRPGDKVTFEFEAGDQVSQHGAALHYNQSVHCSQGSSGDVYNKTDMYFASGQVITISSAGDLIVDANIGTYITSIKIETMPEATYEIETSADGKTTSFWFTGAGRINENDFAVPYMSVSFGNINDLLIVGDDLQSRMFKNDNTETLETDARVDWQPVAGNFYAFRPTGGGKVTVEGGLQGACTHLFVYSNGWEGKDGNIYAATYNTDDDHYISFSFDVEKNKTYYICINNQNESEHGYAFHLHKFTFTNTFHLNELAKVIDLSKETGDVISLTHIEGAQGLGTTPVKVKRCTGNINPTSVTGSIDAYGWLNITRPTFAEGTDEAGTVILDIDTQGGEATFVVTFPYHADFNPAGYTDTKRTYGHTWNFIDPRNSDSNIGNCWIYDGYSSFNKGTTTGILSLGQYKTPGSDMRKETDNREWTLSQRQTGSSGGGHDPYYANVWDMEGDNADMIWETEGLWFDTGTNLSCIYNENDAVDDPFKTNPLNFTSPGATDPDRYVGLLPVTDDKKSSFTIPGLKDGDRVLIFMKSGEGSGANGIFLNITGAKDALGTPINSNDLYKAGGTNWQHDRYEGCYHFIKDGDGNMTFEMKAGTMCKLLYIHIYTGQRIVTTNIVSQTSDDAGKLLFINDKGATLGSAGSASQMSLRFRGKGQNSTSRVLTYSGSLNANSFTGDNFKISGTYNHLLDFTSKVGEVGMFRLRMNDVTYEYERTSDQKITYVADFCDRNFTVGYRDKVDSYPYTWDFTDIQGFSSEKMSDEANNYPIDAASQDEYGYEWDISLFDADGNMKVNTGYDPITNNLIFSPHKIGFGNQLWAGGNVIPETRGLWFYSEDDSKTGYTSEYSSSLYNDCLQITSDGIRFANVPDDEGKRVAWWNYKMVVPDVPADGAVYLRMKRDTSVPDDAKTYSSIDGADVPFVATRFQFASESAKTQLSTDTEVKGDGNYAFYKVDGSTDEWILAVKNTGSMQHLTFTLNGWIVKKVAVSTDPKKVNKLGWATESRDHVIDPELTSYLTGREFKTYIVTGADHASKTVTLAEVEAAKKVMPISGNGDANAYIIRNMNLDTDPNNKEPGRVKILNDGFHLFVPDMHDYIADREDGLTDQKTLQGMTSSLMKSQLIEGTVAQKGGENVYNYVLTTETAIAGTNGENLSGSEQSLNYVGFFRAQKSGVSSSGNQGYLPLTVSTNAKYSFVFVKDWEVPTAIEVPSEKLPNGIESVEGNASYYNMNGQRLNGRPSKSGIYIVNGKKVILK